MYKLLLFSLLLIASPTVAFGGKQFVILKEGSPPSGVPRHKPGKCFVIGAYTVVGGGSPAIQYRLGEVYETEAEANAAMSKFPECN